MHTQVFTVTVTATGAGVQRRFVNYFGAQAIATDEVLGVAKTDFAIGQDMAVDALGIVAVEAGAAVTRGNPVIPDAQGRGIADAGNAANRIGRALNTVTAVGQTLFLLIK